MANTAKYLSYKYAFDRMKVAVARGFHLEAVMIAESVVSDRLHSATGTGEDRVRNNGEIVHVPFAELIERARRRGMAPEMVADLHAWRKSRNLVAHAVARSRPGEPTMAVDDFRALAQQTAQQGIALAKRAKAWQRGTKRDTR
jgi:hypothetical protein